MKKNFQYVRCAVKYCIVDASQDHWSLSLLYIVICNCFSLTLRPFGLSACDLAYSYAIPIFLFVYVCISVCFHI